MLFVVSLYAILFLPDVLDQLRGEVIAALLYVENWFLIFRDLSYFQSAGRPPLLQHVWSLAVEEQFYLFWPLILMLRAHGVGQEPRALLIGVLAGVAISTIEMAILYHPYTDPSRVYYGTDTRVRRAAARLRARVRVGAVATDRPDRPQRGHPARRGRGLQRDRPVLDVPQRRRASTPASTAAGSCSAAMVSAVLIAATVHPASQLVPWLLGFAVFRWIGVRSYGIYLWHWPIYMVTRPHSDVPLTGLPLLVLRLTLTFVAAALSYRYVEEPIRHGAIERQWARYRTATGETRRQLATRFGLAASGITARPGGHRRRARQRRERRPPRPGSRSRRSVVVSAPGRPPRPTAGPRCDDADDRPRHHRAGGRARRRAVTAIGDSVMLGAANQLIGHHRPDVRHADGPAGHHGRRRREPAVLGRAST